MSDALEASTDDDEKLRIHVPSPDTELVLGQGDNKFVGIMGRVAKGGVFFGAGGYPLGVPSADCSYAGFKKAHTTLSVGIGAITSLAQVVKPFYMRWETCVFDVALNAIAAGAGIGPGLKDAAQYQGTAPADGTVNLYGDSGVSFASPLSISATAGISASINASLASVNAVVAASVNGVVASVNGIVAASISAVNTSAIGMNDLSLAARKGTAALHGKRIELGRASCEVPGRAYRELMTGGQAATERIDLRADDCVTIEPGKATDKLQGAPTKLRVMTETIRAETPKSALQVGEELHLHSGPAVLQLGPKGLKLFHAATAIKDAVDGVVKPAEKAWAEAYEAADAIERDLQSKTLVTLGSAVGVGAVAIPTALGASEITDDEAAQAAAVGGLGAVGAGVGAALGAIAVAGVTTLIERKLASRAREAAKTRADVAYRAALDGATAAEKTAITAQGSDPSAPQLEITADAIVLSVGTSKISIKASGIEIETAPGSDVSVNGQTFAMGAMANLAVKA